ncbi:C2H2-type domain-containing protein [Mycena venus]|uniref:C2H2-type domain-containing protein n=1 Tax=Mycena venus TaxID=2733690 RepID=A0A8H6YWX7_9AGAR|nr:C2H2-type domain-containing protein [Mycena venus]
MPRGRKRRLGAGRPELRCPWPGCPKRLKSQAGVTNHVNTAHRHSNSVAGLVPPPLSPSESPEPEDDYSGDLPPTPPRNSPEPEPELPRPQKNYHPFLNARPCDKDGVFLPDGAPPSPRTTSATDDWAPYDDKVQFELADFLFRKVQMSSKNIDQLLEMWALSMMKHDDLGPFHDYKDIYETIDATTVGDAPWKCLRTEPFNTAPDAPAWARQEYEIWYRDPDVVIANMLDNPDLDGAFDTTPYVHLDANGKRHWSDFMSANFAWRHCDQIYEEDPTTEGAMYTPIFFGSDKTTVSVATGDEYHPGYISLGNPHNNIRRAHRNTVMPFVFLAIPKSDRKYDNDPVFRKFKRQLYHASLAAVLSSLKSGMKKPVVRRCPDGHFRRVIYDFGPFIADYPEQVMLAGIVQNWCAKCTALSTHLDGNICGRRTHSLTDELLAAFSPDLLWDSYGIDVDIIPFTRDFPRADIHEMLSSDLLHQVIKGSFKDHLVTWVGEYLYLAHSKGEADAIMDEIDRRIAATPAFPCLRRFKQGRRFKQWTGDDSKALMKASLVPDEIVQAIAAFLDFCYLVRRADFYEDTLDSVDAAVRKFHAHREIFKVLGVRTDTPGGSTAFSLPRQHSMVHYRYGIEEFGAPGGVCSSITESRHITAVKKPWRRSSRYEALSQMLQTNQRLDKLAAARADFVERGMLPSTFVAPVAEPDDDDGGPTDSVRVEGNVVLARTRERRYPRYSFELAQHIHFPTFPTLLARFLTDQLNSDLYSNDGNDIDPAELSTTPLSVFHSAIATFYAPSDPSGIRGMRCERIRSTPSWRKHGARRDCAFAVEDQDKPGFRGMSVVRIKLFFSFTHDGVDYPCALVEWFKKVGRSPDIATGMWVVEPEYRGKNRL